MGIRTDCDLEEDEIWLRSEELRDAFVSKKTEKLTEPEIEMGRLASELRGSGCLAACGVAFVVDSLEGIQEAARIEARLQKWAMGMGLKHLSTASVVLCHLKRRCSIGS